MIKLLIFPPQAFTNFIPRVIKTSKRKSLSKAQRLSITSRVTFNWQARDSFIQATETEERKHQWAFQAAFTVVTMSKSIEIAIDDFDIHSDGLRWKVSPDSRHITSFAAHGGRRVAASNSIAKQFAHFINSFTRLYAPAWISRFYCLFHDCFTTSLISFNTVAYDEMAFIRWVKFLVYRFSLINCRWKVLSRLSHKFFSSENFLTADISFVSLECSRV